MPGFWIRVNSRLADDPEVRSFARALFPSMPVWLSVHSTVGLLCTLWGRVIDEQEDGDLSARDDDVLEEWAKWRGDAGAFAGLYRSVFTVNGIVKEWDEYAGPLIRRRARDRSRKLAEKRAREAREAAIAEATGAVPRAVAADVPHAGRAESGAAPRAGRAENAPGHAEGGAAVTPSSSGNGNGNGNDHNSLKDRPHRVSETEGSGGVSRAALEVLMGAAHMVNVDAFLALRPPENHDRWCSELLKIAGPATGVLPEDLARACEHALIAEPPVRNPKALTAFAVDLRDQRIRASLPPSARRPRSGAGGSAAAIATAPYDPSTNDAARRRLARDQEGDPNG